MPNWVKHTLIVTGEAAALQAFREGVLGRPSEEDKEASPLSFRSILPMPEELNITSGSDGDLGMAALTGEGLASILGCPWLVSAGVTTREGLVEYLKKERPEALVLGQKYIDNIAKYGTATWYGWCNEHWGTKWDACDVNLEEQPDGSLKYYFETAWSFPEPVMAKLAEMFPAVTVQGTVDEEGGWFYGEFTLKDGQLITEFQKGTRKGGPYDYGDEDEGDGDEA